MKNKKLMYALLVASALVWGWVFIKIFNVIFKGDQAPVMKVKTTYKSSDFEQKDTFQLLLNYKDPFLKARSKQVIGAYSSGAVANASAVNRPPKKTEKVVKVEKIIDWSFIKYKGQIRRQSTGKILSLINIGGGDYSLEDGKEVQQVLLIKSYPDSIQVKFDGVKKYIRRNQN